MRISHIRILLALVTCVASFLFTPAQSIYAQDAPKSADVEELFSDPLACINPFKAAHIAAAVASVLPIPVPGFKTAADMAEYGANLALKGCPPHLISPQLIVEPPPQNCELTLQIPLDATYNELNQIDEQLFGLLMQRYHVPASARDDLIDLISSEYGRFENETYGSYSNVYGLELPLELSNWSSGNWGDVGQPDIYHYNSDVSITLRHSGERISDEAVQFRPGSHVLAWEANTLISAFDWIPTFLIPGSDSPQGQKAAKEGATEASKQAVKKAAKEAAEETTGEFIKRILKKLGENVLKKAGLKAGAVSFKLRQPYFVSGEVNASTFATQYLIVQDHTPPSINGADQAVTVEAFLPGGASSAANMGKILATVSASDDCDLSPQLTYNTPAFWPLLVDENGAPLPSATIEWRASDNGAATPSGGVNSTTQSQQVTVVDTLPPILLPPPPVIMESEGRIEVALGQPQVFDVADLRPTVAYTVSSAGPGVQWPVFDQGIHYVAWQATDASKNSSDVSTQLVNIKAPGTNLPAVAFDRMGNDAIEAVADEPIVITVEGADGNDPPDPIWFTVEDAPQNGFFIAPLYPYFIDDYRMTARYSPQIAAAEGEEFAWQLAADPNAMRDYMKALCAEDIERKDLPKDFVSWNGGGQKYIAVDDEGYTYIYDWAYRKCHHGGGTIAPNGTPRISVWDADGVYVGEQERSDSGHPLHDVKFNVGQGTIIAVKSDGSTTGNSLIDIMTIAPENSEEPIVEEQSYGLWNKINRIEVGPDNTSRQPEYKNARSAAWDTVNNVLYVIGTHNLTGMAALRPAPCNSSSGNTEPTDCLDLLGTPIYSHSIVQSTKWGDFPGIGADAMRLWGIRDITVDSTGAVYIAVDPTTSATQFHRIYKFSPATVNADGDVTLGELIGWMGKCSSGAGCNYIDQHSIGFSCTDETCAVEGSLSGSGPGQFNRISAIAMDPKDVLYVADGGNDRVQRFNPDGLFAGEARSQASCPGCTGFVLGDFGSPGNIAVNSNHFYVLDIDSELVHVFEASVIHSIDDTSAWVEYQSDSNYVGDDSFTFRATDGFRTAEGKSIESDPAVVEVKVARNFRPPQAGVGLVISTTEDTPAPFTLRGYDLDGDLDTLSYRVTAEPGYGEISGEGADRTYTPEPDFYGEDSFVFVVNDGREDSEPMLVPIDVAPANDPPTVIVRTSPLAASIGFPFSLDAIIVDADFDDSHSLLVDWGDGVSETTGQIGVDGTLIGPVVLADSTITTTVLGFYTYADPGDKTLRVCATDAAGVEGCATEAVAVQAGVDLALGRDGASVISAEARRLTYALSVKNRTPITGGMVASDVVLEETLAAGATYQVVEANGAFTCNAGGQSLRCQIGDLAVGVQAQVIVTLALDEDVEVGQEIATTSSVRSSAPEAIPDNNELLVNLTLLHAADFIVTSLEDHPDMNPGDGVCAAASGCTLRAAVQETNILAGPQSVALGYGVHQLNIADDSAVLAAASGEPLYVTDHLTVIGLNPDRTIINANGLSRIFYLSDASFAVRDVMLASGHVSASDDVAGGGAILADSGDLRLERVAVTGSEANNGGGLLARNSTVFIAQSAFTDNRALADGSGGVIYNEDSDIVVQNSTFSGNRAGFGGVLMHFGGATSIENATLVANGASGEGGAIFGTVEGVLLNNTILAGNSAPVGANCLGRFVSDGYNLLGNLQDCTVMGQTTTNVFAEGKEWESLARTSAGTYAHPLAAESQAIDAGSCRLATDQRGAARPFGEDCDIGALEYASTMTDESSVYLPTVMR